MEQQTFLQDQQARLTDLLRPYQRELNRRQRLVDFVNACIRSAGRDDFFELYELLHSRTCGEVEAEAGWEEVKDVFAGLRDDAIRKVERSQSTFQEDFARLADEAGLPIENDFPRLRLLKGIELEVEFPNKRTIINGKPLKTVDPQRLIRAVLALKRRLYDRPFVPQEFIDGLFAVYQKVIRTGRTASWATPPLFRPSTWNTPCPYSRAVFFRIWRKGNFASTMPINLRWISGAILLSDVCGHRAGQVLRLTPGRKTPCG